jgi:hypothetical protein
MLVFVQLSARHGSGDLETAGPTIFEKRTALQRLEARLIVHILTTAEGRKHKQREHRTAAHATPTG